MLLHLEYQLLLCDPKIDFKVSGGKSLATDHREPPFFLLMPPRTTQRSICRGEREKGILGAREARLPRARSRAHPCFEGYVTCALHKRHSIISKMADVEIEITSPEKTLEAADNFDMPPPCIPSNLQEKAKTDNEGLKRKSSMKEKKETTAELPYKVPSCSGIPEDLYSLEVLNNGCIISNIDLSSKPFHVFEKGFYIYDLGSTHGTTSLALNRNATTGCVLDTCSNLVEVQGYLFFR